jgi:hypothetical protein
MICLSEEIRFDNEVYKLKFSALAPKTNGYGNEYFIPSENYNNWSKMIGIYYYPNENDPIIFANKFDKTIENTDNSILLKFIENKKTNQSVISFLVNECEKSKKYFEYDIYKFEKQQPKGMIVTKFAVKYFFNKDDEIKQIAQKVKANNDRYLEMLILSQTPQIIEKDIAFEN